MKTKPITLILTLLFCFTGSVLAEKKNQDDAKFKVDVTGSNKSQNLKKINENTSLENQLYQLLINKNSCVVVAKFGIYQSIAILNIRPNGDFNNKFLFLDGVYFYLKHAKIINLKGSFNKATGILKFNETYNKKISGYFEISTKEKGNNFWSKADEKDKEPAELIHVCNSFTLEKDEILHLYFTRVHKIKDYWNPVSIPSNVIDPCKLPGDKSNLEFNIPGVQEVQDQVWACVLPDESLCFKINVIRTNFHMGGWDGVVGYNKKRNIYNYNSIKHDSRCKIKIIMKSADKIIFKDIDCDVCCGAYAYLDGEYNLENFKILGNYNR